MLNFRSKQYREQTSQKISWGHWFALFNIVWAMLIGSRYAFIIDWPDTLFGKMYFFISLIGHFSFVCFAAYLLILFPLSFLIKNERTFRGVAVILATLANTLLFVDTEVFARFNLHLSSLVWNLLVNPENGELSRHWQIFFAPMPFFLLLQMLFSRWAWYRLRSLERQKWIRGLGFTLTGFFIATHLIYAWADAYVYRPITMQKSNFPLSYPMTAHSFLQKHGLLDKAAYSDKVAEEGRPDALKIKYPKQQLAFDSLTEKPQILLINISGLRADAITAEQMPNLTEFAADSAQFTHHYSSGNHHQTGLVGLFYGINAGYLDSILTNKTPSVLLEKLRQEQYQFHVLSVLSAKDTLSQQLLFKEKNRQKDLTNESAVQNLLKLIESTTQETKTKNAEKPWFAYMNLDLIQPMKNQPFSDLATEKQAYQQQLQQLDAQLQPLLTQVSENTLVIITADQGYAFQQDEENIHYFAADKIQVPLLMKGKDIAAGKYNQLTSHTDIVPTLLKDIFKVKNPIADFSDGQPLFAINKSDWVIAANHRWTVIITADGTQYQVDNKGNYQKFDRTYQPQSSIRPPLGLFLDVFKQRNQFIDK